MLKKLLKQLLLCALVLGLFITPPIMAQGPSSSDANVYTMWIKLSLRGYSQEEIESLLRNFSDKQLEAVKERLRRTVISNLELRKVGAMYHNSRDYDDLNAVANAIKTEIRFAGLETDDKLKLRIKDHFGIYIQ